MDDLNITHSGNPIYQAYLREKRHIRSAVFHEYPTWQEYCAFQLAILASFRI